MALDPKIRATATCPKCGLRFEIDPASIKVKCPGHTCGHAFAPQGKRTIESARAEGR